VPAYKQETVLYSFGSGSDGARPQSNLTDVNGVLYGMTYYGGNGACPPADDGYTGCGTVYSVTTSGAESVLYRFAGGSDGAYPLSNLLYVNGVFYGTTPYGGNGGCFENTGCGTVFKITTSGAESVLYRFVGGSDGANPESGLTDVNGVLYGTTAGGGANGDGTVFTISTSGAESVLYSFAGGSDGAGPTGLTEVNGVLYGTTGGGGAGSSGTVYKITTSGAESVLHSFSFGKDGIIPVASLTNVNGVLYGTTASGGRHGYGTVYKITTSGTESVLADFGNGRDGSSPEAGLTYANGWLYGTTSRSYPKLCTYCGTVFKISPSGMDGGGILFIFGGGHGFPPQPDGGNPYAGVTYLKGKLYGTTASGGPTGGGVVYSLTL
jgi:uncharacterized repeat protein (TIGR03803 family)